MIPDHLRYTAEHEWIWLTEAGLARFGITDHAQDALGDIVFVTLPEVGTRIEVGQPCGEVESTKSVADVFAPVTGVVTAVNDSVITAPETINADPYGAGWLAEVELDSANGGNSGLMTATEYEALVANI
ncbi:MAG: glycine cleavage system protein GcvH [Candidatus Nanopelagicales bacterium]|nr:glycine cleavage system protein GcvH [Candidatus Nanopelagicales bacterium]